MNWNKYPDVKPTKEKGYLICDEINNQKFYSVAQWSNDLYAVDEYDFYDRQGKCGFWLLDGDWGCIEKFAAYWAEIEPPERSKAE